MALILGGRLSDDQQRTPAPGHRWAGSGDPCQIPATSSYGKSGLAWLMDVAQRWAVMSRASLTVWVSARTLVTVR